ncbi:MAG: hypothetical protein I4O51_02575 [Flavobacterium micromati]|jgi:hypothetical protein|nr:hypothetical protein [Flavobacterium micromati]
MNLSQVKKELSTLENVAFILPNGTFVPEHFHVTEVGLITKNFIDCGGKVRKETVVNFQLWDANDFDHRLKPKKLLDIIALSEKILGIADNDVEVEFQGETIGKYDLGFNGKAFTLINKQTACLAEDECGITASKQKVKLSKISNQTNSCTPGGGCC